MDQHDPLSLRGLHARQMQWLTSQYSSAASGRSSPARIFMSVDLPAPLLTDHGEDLAGVDRYGNVGQCLHAGVGFADVPHFQEGQGNGHRGRLFPEEGLQLHFKGIHVALLNDFVVDVDDPAAGDGRLVTLGHLRQES